MNSSEQLLLKPREAAHNLGISERTLFSLTKEREIPAIRLGRSVRYSPKDLERFIDSRRENGSN